MFRFFVCINLILVHVFCQTAEDNLQFNTDFLSTESWQEESTDDQIWQSDTNYDASQSWNEITTEESLSFNTSDETNQSLNETTTDESFSFNTSDETNQPWNEMTTEESFSFNTSDETWNEMTTEESFSFNTSDETNQPWNEMTTEESFSFNTSDETNQPWNEMTTEESFSFNTSDETWNEMTTEESFSFNTSDETNEPWNEMTTEQSLELSTNIDTSQVWEEITTEKPLPSNTEGDTTQTWEDYTTEESSEQENFTTMQQITSTTTESCPPSITIDMLEEIKKEIIEEVLANLSREINSKLEELEERLSQLNCSNNESSSAIKLSWLIYENLQIPLTGWLLVFDQPYSHKTRIDDLNQIAGICHNEVFVGATYNGSIALAAVGPASILTLNTPWNQPQQFGQVYWYRNSGKSFGFSPTATIRQTQGDNQDLDSSLRLSWLLDQNTGGYRAGVARSLFDDSFWHKVIYCN